MRSPVERFNGGLITRPTREIRIGGMGGGDIQRRRLALPFPEDILFRFLELLLLLSSLSEFWVGVTVDVTSISSSSSSSTLAIIAANFETPPPLRRASFFCLLCTLESTVTVRLLLPGIGAFDDADSAVLLELAAISPHWLVSRISKSEARGCVSIDADEVEGAG